MKNTTEYVQLQASAIQRSPLSLLSFEFSSGHRPFVHIASGKSAPKLGSS